MPSKFDRLSQRMQRYPSEARLILMRNLALGSAAACLAVLIQILQVDALDEALNISVLATAVGMPLWLGFSVFYEYYIFLGPRSYPHLRTATRSPFVGAFALLPGMALLMAIGGVLWHLLPDAAFVFGGITLAVIVFLLGFHAYVAYWWFGDKGPGFNESDIDS